MRETEKILKELQELEERKQTLLKELEKAKAEKFGFKYKIILPYECQASVYGDYVAYFKTKEEADEVMEKVRRGEALFSDVEWEFSSEEIADTWNDDFIYDEAELVKIN